MTKPHLKGVKAPNRWLNLNFSKSDAAATEQRKALLEKYLQQLCYHPVLGHCEVLLEFMAYGEEGFHVFGSHQLSTDPFTQRIDKVCIHILNFCTFWELLSQNFLFRTSYIFRLPKLLLECLHL